MSKENKYFLGGILLYYLLNILNTYLLTTSTMNRYIVTFERHFTSEITSVIGNIAALSIILSIGFWFFKRKKNILIYLSAITLVLNVVIIALGFFSKNYRAMFSIYNFALMKNPEGGFTNSVVMDVFYELIYYYRIIVFIPAILMLAYYIYSRKFISNNKMKVNFIRRILMTSCSFLLSVGILLLFQSSVKNNWMFRSEIPLYGSQYAGVYNYYISEFFYRIDYRTRFETEDMKLINDKLDLYNKNKNEYINIIDNKTYSNTDYQTGIWEGKNVYIIQLESYNNFVLNNSFNNIEVTPNFNNLLVDERYRNMIFYFNNVYTNVGMGNTADAEFAFNTGYFPVGDMTIHWEFADSKFNIPSLANQLSDTYVKYGFNGTNENFYNHKDVMENLFGYDKFYALNSFLDVYPKGENTDKYLYNWISDRYIMQWAGELVKQQEKEKFFIFNMTITPHLPFVKMAEYYNTDPYYSNYVVNDWGSGLGANLPNYLDQVHHNDKILYDFLISSLDNTSPNYLEDTVFIIYGDHGNGIDKTYYDSLFNAKLGRNLTEFEFRKLLLNIPVIIIDPSYSLYNSLVDSNVNINEVLTQVKSQRDLYRTLINALSIPTAESYYGVNLFSGEPSFTYDPKNVDIILDAVTYSYKNERFEMNAGYENVALPLVTIESIAEYKKYQDIYLSMLVKKGTHR